MMKTALASLLLLSAFSSAQDAPAAPSFKLWLADSKFFNAQPQKGADYYILLRSASWCSPCRKEMPAIVKAYAQMKASGKVELILLAADADEHRAQKYLDGYKAKFPATMDASLVQGLPRSQAIPQAYVFNKDGKLLNRGYGSIVLKWRFSTLDYAQNREQVKQQMDSFVHPPQVTRKHP